MNTVTITKTEYQKLQNQSKAYQKLASNVFQFALKDPIQEVVDDFKKTDLYTDEFLIDLEDGLRESSYAAKTNKQKIG